MSYLGQSQLEMDPTFQGRVRAADTQQAESFINDGRPDMAACARGVLRNDPGVGDCFLRLAAGGPGIADKVDNGDGTIDQSRVSDADLLSLTQTNFPTVADLFFTDEGTPI